MGSHRAAEHQNRQEFVERLEAVLAVNLILSTYVKNVLFYYAFVLGAAQFFKFRDYRPLVFPTGMIVFGLAFLVSPNIVYYNEVIMRYWVDLDVLVGLILPLILLALYKMMSRSKGNNPAKV
jgi:spore germination protein KB